MKRELMAEIDSRLEETKENPARSAFAARSVRAALELAEMLDGEQLAEALAAPSNLAAVVAALQQPAVAGRLIEADPLAKAKLRGAIVRDQWLEAEGGTMGVDDVAARLHITRQAVDKRRKAGTLLAVDVGRHGYRYPVWQFTDGGVLPALDEILSLLGEHSPLAQLGFFLSDNIALDGRRPLDLLRGDDVEPVRRAARAFGHQLAL